MIKPGAGSRSTSPQSKDKKKSGTRLSAIIENQEDALLEVTQEQETNSRSNHTKTNTQKSVDSNNPNTSLMKPTSLALHGSNSQRNFGLSEVENSRGPNGERFELAKPFEPAASMLDAQNRGPSQN